jgi:DNA topoisomerase I
MRDATPDGLVYATDDRPGIRRIARRRGRHVDFEYLGLQGRPIRSASVLRRIQSLAIPPAYEDVWICPDARGHLQATGRDARGRKQYRYHPRWRLARDEDKHARMLRFGAALPRLRRAVASDLRRPGLPREKVLALVVRLLDETQARVGNTEYARTNGSFGLSTLRDRHARFGPGGVAHLTFRGKGGLPHEIRIDDPRVARLVRRCQELPGQQLFQYVDEDGRRRGIDSGSVNAYLREKMGEAFSAKDFRTWHATVQALDRLCVLPLPEQGGERARRQCVQAVVKDVASLLRNTPTVCRKSYINPAVFEAWEAGLLAATAGRPRRRGAVALLQLLRRKRRAP